MQCYILHRAHWCSGYMFELLFTHGSIQVPLGQLNFDWFFRVLVADTSYQQMYLHKGDPPLQMYLRH